MRNARPSKKARYCLVQNVVRLYRALKSIYTEVSEIYLTAVLAMPAYRDVHKLENEHL